MQSKQRTLAAGMLFLGAGVVFLGTAAAAQLPAFYGVGAAFLGLAGGVFLRGRGAP